MARTLNETIRICTETYLNQINVNNPPEPADIEAELVTLVKDACMLENQMRAQSGMGNKDKLIPPKTLCPAQIASIMLKLYHIVRVKCGGVNADPSYDLLSIYMDSGPNICDG